MLKVKLGFFTTQLKSGCYFDSECAPPTPSVPSRTAAAAARSLCAVLHGAAGVFPLLGIK